MEITVGIVVLNYNTYSDTIVCVDTIIATIHKKYKIYIVDNQSSDGSFEMLRRKYVQNMDVEVILTQENSGFSNGNNYGIRAAIADGAKYILLTNPDVEFYKNAIDSMVNNLDRDEEIGVIGPIVKFTDRNFNPNLCRKPYNTLRYLFSRKPLYYLRNISQKLQTEINVNRSKRKSIYKFRGMVSGCCFLIRNSLIEEIGYLDEIPFLYFEEMILAKKMEKTDYITALDLNASILHKEKQSTSKIGTAFQTYHLYLSGFYFMKRYVHTNFLFLFGIGVQNGLVYSLRALQDPSYANLWKKFINKQKELLFKNTFAPIKN